jgi:hypothetical protein
LGLIFHHNHKTKRKEFSVHEKMGVLTQVDANKEIHIALIATVGTVVLTLLKTGKTMKSVIHNMASSLVKGRTRNNRPFRNWRVCWMCGLNKLEAAILTGILLRAIASVCHMMNCFYTNVFLTSCFILSVMDGKIEQFVHIKVCLKLCKSTIRTLEMLR